MIDTLERLERIYQSAGDHDRLREILERKAGAVEDPEEAANAKLRLAEVYEDDMGDVEKAIATYAEVREIHPDNLQALKGL